MPVTEKKYPDWVQKHRTKGTTVKKRGDSYYLYKRTSRRVKGKKYPQPVDTYIGVITPEGVIQSNKRKVDLTDAEVWEYGFSKAVWELCPDDWKKPLGDDWQDVLSIILLKQSPTSYIQKTRMMKKESDFRYQFAAQTRSCRNAGMCHPRIPLWPDNDPQEPEMVQNPSGRAAETYEIKIRDCLTFHHYPDAVWH